MNNLIQSTKINKYTIRQVINGKVIFFKDIYSTYNDYLVFKSMLLHPKEDEFIKECSLLKIMGQDKQTGAKIYFFNFALNTNVVPNEKVLFARLKGRVYNGVSFEKIHILGWRDKLLKNYLRKGRDFEEYTVQHYIKQKYNITKNFLKGKNDEGIDIIAFKGEELLLIQCKNWEIPLITQKELKEFLGSCYIFLYKYAQYRKMKVRRIFVSSSLDISESADRLINSISPFLELQILPFKPKFKS